MSDFGPVTKHIQNYVKDLYRREDRAAREAADAASKSDEVKAKLDSAIALLTDLGAEIPEKDTYASEFTYVDFEELEEDDEF